MTPPRLRLPLLLPGLLVGLQVGLLLGGGCDRDAPPPLRRDQAIRARAQVVQKSKQTLTKNCSAKKTFYRDADGDGFGDRKRSVQACLPPAGFVDNAEDCYDSNRRARPGQRDYYATHRGDGSYDYDCDTQQTRRFTSRAFCRLKDSQDGCVHSSGWAKGPIPKCGQPADFAWKVCREQVVVTAPPGAPDAGAPVSLSAGALVPGAKQQKIYKCYGRKLPWKKRQLCR